MADTASKAAAAATDAAQTASDAAAQASTHADTAQAAADAATAAKAAVDEHVSAIMDAAQGLANSPPASPYSKPTASILTNAYAFNQAVQWLASTAANAADLASLQSFLKDLAGNTQALVDSIDAGERQTLARIASGVPRVGGGAQ